MNETVKEAKSERGKIKENSQEEKKTGCTRREETQRGIRSKVRHIAHAECGPEEILEETKEKKRKKNNKKQKR
jgi:hypothetical protein